MPSFIFPSATAGNDFFQILIRYTHTVPYSSQRPKLRFNILFVLGYVYRKTFSVTVDLSECILYFVVNKTIIVLSSH